MVAPSSCVGGHPLLTPLVAAIVSTPLLCGCGDSSDGEPSDCPPGEELGPDGRCRPIPTTCPPGETLVDGECVAPPCSPGHWLNDGACLAAGVPADMACAPGEQELEDGSCLPAGVSPDDVTGAGPLQRCGEGFVHDGDRGCEPILPAAPCGPGELAVPGETECREIAPCGTGSWGDIPVENDTQYVDASFGGMSDGSFSSPWTTIQAGVDAAASGAIVAVAAGSYSELVVVGGKPVRLWGRCPAQVEIQGPPSTPFTLGVLSGADGTEVRSLALTGVGRGIQVQDVTGVVLDSLWVHHNSFVGIWLGDGAAATEASLHNVLSEHNPVIGVFAGGATVTVDRSVIRDTLPTPALGIGILGEFGNTTLSPATVVVRDSVVERSRDCGIAVESSDLTVERSVVRDVELDAATERGVGIWAHRDVDIDVAPTVSVSHTLVERVHGAAITTVSGALTVDGTVMRDVETEGTGTFGQGVEITQNLEGGAPSLVLRSSLIQDVVGYGVRGSGADLVVESVAIRDVQASQTSHADGVAIIDFNGTPGGLTLRSSVIERAANYAVVLEASDGLVETTLIRDNQPSGGSGTGFGRGVQAVDSMDSDLTGSLIMRSSRIENVQEVAILLGTTSARIESTDVSQVATNATGLRGMGIAVDHRAAAADLVGVRVSETNEAGILMYGPTATVDGSVLTSTVPGYIGMAGDGIVVLSVAGPSSLVVTNTLIANNARAGISNFGGRVEYANLALSCQDFDLDGEVTLERDFTFVDMGANACGCPTADGSCQVVSAGLTAPEPVTPVAGLDE